MNVLLMCVGSTNTGKRKYVNTHCVLFNAPQIGTERIEPIWESKPRKPTKIIHNSISPPQTQQLIF